MTVDAPKIFPPLEGRRTRWAWVAMLAVIIFTGAIRLRLANVPLERDEGEYAYTGQLMLRGIPPYQGSYFMKLPGTHAMYALGMAIFGQTRTGIHHWLLVVNAASIVLVFLLGRKLAAPVAGVVASAAYSVMSLCPCVLGPVAHATQFVVLFTLMGLFALCKAIETRRGAIYLLSGLFFGLGILMKQPAALFFVFGALLIVWSERRGGAFRWRVLIWRGVLFGCGAVLPFVATCFILWRAGVFDRFWFWTVTCVRAYGTAVPVMLAIKNLENYFLLNLDASMVLWVLGIAGAFCVWKDREAGVARVFIPALIIISAVAVSQGMYFRPHYFIMLLPGLALGLGVGVSSMSRLILKSKPGSSLAAMPARYMAIALLIVVAGDWKFFFAMTPDDACRRMYYPGEAFVEIVPIADYIKSHSAAEDKIAVIGSEPEIYFYSGRQAATGYIYTYTLMVPGPFAKQMQQDMIQQVEEAKPKFLVFVDMPNSWDREEASETAILSWQPKYRRDFYELTGRVDLPADKPAVFHWGKEAVTTQPAEECIDVFQRQAGK